MPDQPILGYLGYSFQIKVLSQILHDKNFAESIIPILDPSYFDDASCKLIAKLLKEYHARYNSVPSYDTLESLIKIEIRTEIQRQYLLDVVKEIRNTPLTDGEWVQEKSFKFCKQQELKKAIKRAEEILERGDFERYDEIEEDIKKALSFNLNNNEAISVFHNLENVMKNDHRDTIPIGIEGLDALFKGVARGEILVVLAPMGVGKALPNSEKVLTPVGWKLMGDINIGDIIVGSDGKQQMVVGVFPQGVRDIYRVDFNDGTSARCDGDHLWSVSLYNSQKVKKDNFINKTTLEIANDLKKDNKLRYQVPLIKPVEFIKQPLLIDPYVLGVLLGSGNLKNGKILTKDNDIIDYIISKFVDSKVQFKISKNRNRINIIQLLNIEDQLSKLNLLNIESDAKFIPNSYLFNDVDSRVNLLQGLLDSNAKLSKSGKVQFYTTSKQLSINVRELILSLGGFCRVKIRQSKYRYRNEIKYGKILYILTISFPNHNFDLFKISQKQKQVKYDDKYFNVKIIKNIEYIGKENATCILVSNDDHLFVTNDYILTHNTTFLTKVANSAFNFGANVLQIFFEDTVSEIQRKHISCWTGIPLTEMNEDTLKDPQVIKILNDLQKKPNKLLLQRWPSDSITMTQIKSYIRKLKTEGIPIDMVIIDYIDCVIPERGTDDVFTDEGKVMRKFESMCHELNIAGVTATQGNRSSISADIVTNDQMGGSIKKAQIGHIIISIAKTLAQKESGLATMAVLKSRVSKDGLVFENCIFNNERMEISTEQPETFLGFEMNKSNKQRERASQLYKARKGISNTNISINEQQFINNQTENV